MAPDETLVALCRALDPGELSGERVFDELGKLLLRAAKPSIGFRVLEDTGQLRIFPELDALRGVPQDPEWHPEGDVWVHTLMVLDVAATLRGARAGRRRDRPGPGTDAGRRPPARRWRRRARALARRGRRRHRNRPGPGADAGRRVPA